MGIFETMFEKIEEKKKLKEEQEQADRDTVRYSVKTKVLTEAVCKAFLPDGFCFKRLCDPNVAAFHVKVLKWGIIAETSYFRKVEESLFKQEVLIRFCDLAINDLKNNAMANELQKVLLEEIVKLPTISVANNGNISLIKGSW